MQGFSANETISGNETVSQAHTHHYSVPDNPCACACTFRLHWLKPKWCQRSYVPFTNPKDIDIVCALRLHFLLFYGKINTRRIFQFIWHANYYTGTIFKCRELHLHFSLFVHLCTSFFLSCCYCCSFNWWWLLVFVSTWVEIGSTQHFLPIFRKLHQIKWTTVCILSAKKNADFKQQQYQSKQNVQETLCSRPFCSVN